MIRKQVPTLDFHEAVDGLLDAFEGRYDVVGLDDDGHGHPGPSEVHNREEWVRHATAHLKGEMSMGVYPVTQDCVLWGCVDFDEGEVASQCHARNLAVVLAHFDVTGWIERSRSKGYHLWVFAPEWVPARLMRKALLGACQTVDAPIREINPKSETLDPEEYGNFVRLPFYGAAKGRLERQVILHPQSLQPLSLALFLGNLERDATYERLEALAALYEVPVPPVVRRLEAVDADVPWMERLDARARSFVKAGPNAERDRSGYLMATANACAAAGLSMEDVMAAVRYADDLHCQKFTRRRDADKRYEEMATKAIAWSLLEGISDP